MNPDSIYQDGAYLRRNPSWHQEDSPWKARQILRILEKNSVVPSTLCEIGCGAGEILTWLSAKFGDSTQLFGYDISPQAFALCQSKSTPNLHFFLADLLEERDRVFDVVMAIDVMEHVEDYMGFLRKLRVAGTYKVFHIPLDLSVQTVLRAAPIVAGRYSVGHLHYFTKETALATLNDTGYEVVDYFYTRRSIELPVYGWKANLLKQPKRIGFAIHQDLTVRLLGGFSLLVLAR